LMHLAAFFFIVLAVEHRPSRGNHDQSTAHLDDRQRNAKKTKQVRPDHERYDQQDETVDGDAARQQPARFLRVILCQGQENRTASQRIDDREQRAGYQDSCLDDLGQVKHGGQYIRYASVSRDSLGPMRLSDFYGDYYLADVPLRVIRDVN